jgi:D-xylose 1-dehydrogenase
MTVTAGHAQYPSLRDAFVLITGGASWIGAVMVSEFARQRARVGFLDISIEAAARLLASLQLDVSCMLSLLYLLIYAELALDL